MSLRRIKKSFSKSFSSHDNQENILIEEILEKREKEKWQKFFVSLDNKEIKWYQITEKGEKGKKRGEYELIGASCEDASTIPPNPRPNSFLIYKIRTVLHFGCSSQEQNQNWLNLLQQVISGEIAPVPSISEEEKSPTPKKRPLRKNQNGELEETHVNITYKNNSKSHSKTIQVTSSSSSLRARTPSPNFQSKLSAQNSQHQLSPITQTKSFPISQSMSSFSDSQSFRPHSPSSPPKASQSDVKPFRSNTHQSSIKNEEVENIIYSSVNEGSSYETNQKLNEGPSQYELLSTETNSNYKQLSEITTKQKFENASGDIIELHLKSTHHDPSLNSNEYFWRVKLQDKFGILLGKDTSSKWWIKLDQSDLILPLPNDYTIMQYDTTKDPSILNQTIFPRTAFYIFLLGTKMENNPISKLPKQILKRIYNFLWDSFDNAVFMADEEHWRLNQKVISYLMTKDNKYFFHKDTIQDDAVQLIQLFMKLIQKQSSLGVDIPFETPMDKLKLWKKFEEWFYPLSRNKLGFDVEQISQILGKNFFYGWIDAEWSQKILKGKTNGTYFFRFSTQQGCYTLSVVENQKIYHWRIICKKLHWKPAQFRVEKEIYSSLEDIIERHGPDKEPLTAKNIPTGVHLRKVFDLTVFYN